MQSSSLPNETISKIRAIVDPLRLPEGKMCGQCCNYRDHCRIVLKGEKEFDGVSRYCYFGPAKDYFDKPIGFASTPEQLAEARAWRTR